MNKVRLLFCSFILFSVVQISGCIMPHSTVLYATKDDEVAVQEMKDKYGEDVDIVLTKLEQVIQELVTNELNNEYFVDFNDIWFYTEKQFERFKQSHTDAMCRHYLGYYTAIDVLPDVYPNDKSESYQHSVALYTGTKDMIERLREDWLNKKQ